MARLQSTQKPTTLLTLKKDKQESNVYPSQSPGEIILITEDGIVDGDVRFTKGAESIYGWKGTFSLYPIGSIIYYAGSVAPDGYLACNGQAYDKNLYPELFAKIGYTWGSSAGKFKVPNFQNPTGSPYKVTSSSSHINGISNITNTNIEDHYIGGLFIRNLNEKGINSNVDGPDYYQLYVTRLGLWDTRLYSGLSRYIVDRGWGPGHIQEDLFVRHRHQPQSTNTTSDGAHNHRYYGAPRSRYYVDDNGVKYDGLTYYKDSLTGDYTTSSTNANGGSNPRYYKKYNGKSISDSHMVGDNGYGRKLGAYEDASVDYRGYYLNFGIYSTTKPLGKNTRTTREAGAHVHYGYMGYGANIADRENTTYLDRLGQEDLDNSVETRPKNYSVLFCIKY